MPYALIINGNQITILEGNYPQLGVGLDSEKISSPSIGNIHIATDTGKTYICFYAGNWSLLDSKNRISYSNHLGNVDNMMSIGATQTTTATENALTHSMDLSAGGLVAGVCNYYMNFPCDSTVANYIFNAKVSGIAVGAGSTTKKTMIGMMLSTVNDFGVSFQCDNTGVWSAYSSDAFETERTTIADVVDGDTLTITMTGNTFAVFSVNGVKVAQHTVGNAPGGALYPCAVLNCGNNTGTPRTLSVDYIGIEEMR